MTDFSKLSDQELMNLYQQQQQQPAQPKPPSEMTDAELTAAYNSAQPKPRYQTWPERLIRGAINDVGTFARAAGGDTVIQPEIPGQLSDVDEARRQATDAAILKSAAGTAALLSPQNPFVRSGDMVIPGVATTIGKVAPPVPSADALKLAGATDIQAAKASPLAVTPESAAGWSVRAQQRLFEHGIHPTDAPSTFAKLKELENAPPGASFTASNMQSFRKSLGNTAQNFNPQAASDQLAASLAIKDFDQFIPSLTETDILAGTPAATQALFERGRGNYAAAQRSNDITGELDRAKTGILERAEGRAQAANSGRNLDNTLRSKVEALLEKPKAVSGFNEAELGAMENFVAGSKGRNRARYVGNLFGGGGGLGQYVVGSMGPASGAAAGAAVGGIPGAVVGAGIGAIPVGVGAAAKSLANALSKKELSALDEMIRSRSPLYQEALRNAPSTANPSAKQDALVRVLLSGLVSGQQQQ